MSTHIIRPGFTRDPNAEIAICEALGLTPSEVAREQITIDDSGEVALVTWTSQKVIPIEDAHRALTIAFGSSGLYVLAGEVLDDNPVPSM